MSDPDAMERRARMIAAMCGLAYSTFLLWTLIPAHQRQLLKMRALAASSTAAGKCARRAGAASMGAELRTGWRLYAVPAVLSRLRDRLARAYDAERKGLA